MSDVAARRGRMMSTGEVAVEVGDLAALLAAAAWYPATPAEPVTPTEAVLARCWADLIAVDPDLAQQTLTTAATDGARVDHIVSLAEMFPTPHKKAEPQ